MVQIAVRILSNPIVKEIGKTVVVTAAGVLVKRLGEGRDPSAAAAR